MSPRVIRAVVAAALLAAAAGAWTWWRSPERRLARRLDALVELLEKDGEEGSLPAAATARAAVDFFAPGFLVRARPYEGSLADPRELTGAVLRFPLTWLYGPVAACFALMIVRYLQLAGGRGWRIEQDRDTHVG